MMFGANCTDCPLTAESGIIVLPAALALNFCSPPLSPEVAIGQHSILFLSLVFLRRLL